MDYKNVLLGRATEALWVCDNCYLRFKTKYKFSLKRGSKPLTNEERLEEQRKTDKE